MKTIFKFIFVFTSFTILVFSLIISLNGPMTSGNIYVKNYYSNINGMNIQDCNKITELLNSELNTDRKDFFKKERNKCRRLKAMCDLEYFISFFNCTFAFLCCIFGFLIEDSDYRVISGAFGIHFLLWDLF